MQPLFENKCRLTRDFICGYVRWVSGKQKQQFWMFFALIIGGLYAAITGYLLRSSPTGLMIALGAALAAAAGIFLLVRIGQAGAARKEADMAELAHGKDAEQTVQFFPGELRLILPRHQAKIPYDSVKAVFEAKGYLVLTDGEHVFAVPREGFTVGDYQGLRALLKEKCPAGKKLR